MEQKEQKENAETFFFLKRVKISLLHDFHIWALTLRVRESENERERERVRERENEREWEREREREGER